MKKQGMLSDSDITRLENRFKKIFLTKKDSEKFLTKSEEDMEFLAKRLGENFLTKEEFNNYKDKIFTILDKILHEVVSTREEISVLSHRSSNHEDRLDELDKIHPKGKHTS